MRIAVCDDSNIVAAFMEEYISSLNLEAIEQINTEKKIYFFKIGKQQFQVFYNEILYFEGNRRKVRIVTTAGEWEFYSKISDVYQQIDPTIFLQIHASYIVNMEHIRCITDREVTLTSGTILPISKRFRNEARQRHMTYMEWRCGG